MKKFIIIIVTLFISILMLIFLLGKGDIIYVNDYPAYDHFIIDPRLKQTENFNATKLIVINTATSNSKKGMVLGGESFFKDYTISHSALMIEHGQDRLLFDTGLGSHIDEQFLQMPKLLQPLLKYEFIEDAASQLEKNNIIINNIILSHLHWDHAGGIEDFPNANIWTSKEDLDQSMLRNEGSLKSQLDSKTIKWNFINFNSGPYENFNESVDFFGDGSVVIVPLPGHTNGSVGIFVNLKSGQRYLLTGDATYGVEGFSKPVEKSFMLKHALDSNRKELIETILKVHYLIKKHPNLIVIPAHDYIEQSKLLQFTK